MTNEIATQGKGKLVERFAERFGVDPDKMLHTLKSTVFQSDAGITHEQMMMLLVVADQHKLNPFTREIYAFPKDGGIVPVVGVDGWARIINEHKQFDGMDFEFDATASCTCTIYRKDRAHPTRVTEYMAECSKNTGPWKSHPRRMLRHKAMIQCARIAFGFTGIFDEDEAERIQEVHIEQPRSLPKPTIEEMPDDEFCANLDEYRQLMADGMAADDLVGMVSTRYIITDAQLSTLYDIEDNNQENENEAIDA